MKTEEMNIMLRVAFQELIDGGYKKRHICSLTLGAQSEPQFEGFIQGKDFGVKPLERILNAFGYDLLLIAIPKDDEESSRNINETNINFISTCKNKLTEYFLNNCLHSGA